MDQLEQDELGALAVLRLEEVEELLHEVCVCVGRTCGVSGEMRWRLGDAVEIGRCDGDWEMRRRLGEAMEMGRYDGDGER